MLNSIVLFLASTPAIISTASEQGLSTGAAIFVWGLGIACVSLLLWMLLGLRRILSTPLETTTTPAANATAEMDLETALKTPEGRRTLLLGVRSIAVVMRTLVAGRYQHKTDLSLLEIGPGLTVTVPTTFGERVKDYTAVDCIKLSLDANRERLTEVGLAHKSTHVQANVKNMSAVASESRDIAVACYVPVFATGSAADQRVAFKELFRVLKPGGELVLMPWTPSVPDNDEVYSYFEVAGSESTNDQSGGEIVATILVRKPAAEAEDTSKAA